MYGVAHVPRGTCTVWYKYGLAHIRWGINGGKVPFMLDSSLLTFSIYTYKVSNLSKVIILIPRMLSQQSKYIYHRIHFKIVFLMHMLRNCAKLVGLP